MTNTAGVRAFLSRTVTHTFHAEGGAVRATHTHMGILIGGPRLHYFPPPREEYGGHVQSFLKITTLLLGKVASSSFFCLVFLRFFSFASSLCVSRPPRTGDRGYFRAREREKKGRQQGREVNTRPFSVEKGGAREVDVGEVPGRFDSRFRGWPRPPLFATLNSSLLLRVARSPWRKYTPFSLEINQAARDFFRRHIPNVHFLLHFYGQILLRCHFFSKKCQDKFFAKM